MTKEVFVSSTPHETKVGIVEDDLLAEIYLERENEYTLAGSIYKGRVTRVLPGMQSAFVDIGLERDAFLYVSDFMELHDEDEVEEIPANRAVPAQASPAAPVQSQPAVAEHEPAASEEKPSGDTAQAASQGGGNSEQPSGGAQGDGRGDWRNRRRRRGRRGDRLPESKFARAGSGERSERTDHSERSGPGEYGPPPGYQPILLPGESISKYRSAQPQSAAPREAQSSATPEVPTPVTAAFAEDEPLFAESEARLAEEHRGEIPEMGRAAAAAQVGSAEWDREQKRLHQANVAAVFGEQGREEDTEESSKAVSFPEPSDQVPLSAAGGRLHEEEIEEEETDLPAYADDLEQDAFEEDEMEEETRAAADYHGSVAREIAAAAEPSATELTQPVMAESVTDETAISEEEITDEAAEEEAEEAEIEEAQAEAEALMDAEARGNGSVDARAEMRASAGTAGYTQRAQRPSFDRRGPRGRRGGRRFRRREPQQIPQITDLLKEGQEILVQIAKEPIGKKGARITSHIALPGRFLVYMPTVNHTGVSRKIASEEERQRLKRIIISERENGHGGFIVRTAAQGASEDELRADIRFLKNLWSEIKARAESGKAPALIYHDLNVVERVLRDQVTSDFSAVWVDTEQEYERVLRFANRFQPGMVKRVKLYTKETPLFEQFGLSDEINKALKSKVWLKSGGYIVINQAEALVAIDVNTGKYVGKTARLEDTIVKTNVDAIREIVRQIRLRDLGGIIIIDFIDMDERRNRQKVMQALEEALRSDRSPSKVLQFNDFGLVAITRKRVKQSLERTIGAPCPYCQSTGFIKSIPTVCDEIYIEMRKIARHLEHSDVMLRVHPEVAKALKSSNGRLLNELEELTKKTVIVKSDPALHQEQFDIN